MAEQTYVNQQNSEQTHYRDDSIMLDVCNFVYFTFTCTGCISIWEVSVLICIHEFMFPVRNFQSIVFQHCGRN